MPARRGRPREATTLRLPAGRETRDARTGVLRRRSPFLRPAARSIVTSETRDLAGDQLEPARSARQRDERTPRRPQRHPVHGAANHGELAVDTESRAHARSRAARAPGSRPGRRGTRGRAIRAATAAACPAAARPRAGPGSTGRARARLRPRARRHTRSRRRRPSRTRAAGCAARRPRRSRRAHPSMHSSRCRHDLTR